MAKIQGVIDFVNTRQTKVGEVYGIKVNGQEYGLFKTKCPFPQGTLVEFQATQNGNFWNVDKGTLRKVEGEAAAAPAAVQATSTYDARQKSIEYQSSRNLAGQVLASLVAADAIAMPSKTDKAARYDAMMALLDDLTWQFFEEVDSLQERKEEREFLKQQGEHSDE